MVVQKRQVDDDGGVSLRLARPLVCISEPGNSGMSATPIVPRLGGQCGEGGSKRNRTVVMWSKVHHNRAFICLRLEQANC